MRVEPTTEKTVLFPDLFDRPLVARFDEPHASSDGGAILLTAAPSAAEPLAKVERKGRKVADETLPVPNFKSVTDSGYPGDPS